jgi:hypothetical protein
MIDRSGFSSLHVQKAGSCPLAATAFVRSYSGRILKITTRLYLLLCLLNDTGMPGIFLRVKDGRSIRMTASAPSVSLVFGQCGSLYISQPVAGIALKPMCSGQVVASAYCSVCPVRAYTDWTICRPP